MINELLARIFFNQWMVFFVTNSLFFLIAELGYRFGLAYHRRNPGVVSGDSGGIQGAVLGLLGLLLGFTFAMAVGRYDTRYALIVNEANSIGTTWLRTEFLQGQQRTEARDLLVRYAELKSLATSTPNQTSEIREEIGGIQRKLWSIATKVATDSPTPITASFISTLNETIDFDASNLSAMRNRVPGAVWLLLLVVASSGAWVSGYGCGLAGLRSTFGQIIFPILIGIVITLISDIDRPQKGVIGLSKEPITNLLKSMRE